MDDFHKTKSHQQSASIEGVKVGMGGGWTCVTGLDAKYGCSLEEGAKSPHFSKSRVLQHLQKTATNVLSDCGHYCTLLALGSYQQK